MGSGGPRADLRKASLEASGYYLLPSCWGLNSREPGSSVASCWARECGAGVPVTTDWCSDPARAVELEGPHMAGVRGSNLPSVTFGGAFTP